MKISVQKITLIGIFTALSLIIFMVEAQFPVMPIGGMKLGLANIVTMAAMLFIGRKEAGLVLLLRIVPCGRALRNCGELCVLTHRRNFSVSRHVHCGFESW